MAEGGYDESDPLLDNQDDYDDDTDIQMDEGEQAETSFGGTGLSATETQLRDSVVDDFYKHLEYEPSIKDYKLNSSKRHITFYKRRKRNNSK